VKVVSVDDRLRSSFPDGGQVDRELLLAVHLQEAIHGLLIVGGHGAGPRSDGLAGQAEVLADVPRIQGDDLGGGQAVALLHSFTPDVLYLLISVQVHPDAHVTLAGPLSRHPDLCAHLEHLLVPRMHKPVKLLKTLFLCYPDH